MHHCSYFWGNPQKQRAKNQRAKNQRAKKQRAEKKNNGKNTKQPRGKNHSRDPRNGKDIDLFNHMKFETDRIVTEMDRLVAERALHQAFMEQNAPLRALVEKSARRMEANYQKSLLSNSSDGESDGESDDETDDDNDDKNGSTDDDNGYDYYRGKDWQKDPSQIQRNIELGSKIAKATKAEKHLHKNARQPRNGPRRNGPRRNGPCRKSGKYGMDRYH